MEQTQGEIQKHKEKNDVHITELERIQQRLGDMKKKFCEMSVGHRDGCGLAGVGNGNTDENKDFQDGDGKAKGC